MKQLYCSFIDIFVDVYTIGSIFQPTSSTVDSFTGFAVSESDSCNWRSDVSCITFLQTMCDRDITLFYWNTKLVIEDFENRLLSCLAWRALVAGVVRSSSSFCKRFQRKSGDQQIVPACVRLKIFNS